MLRALHPSGLHSPLPHPSTDGIPRCHAVTPLNGLDRAGENEPLREPLADGVTSTVQPTRVIPLHLDRKPSRSRSVTRGMTKSIALSPLERQ